MVLKVRFPFSRKEKTALNVRIWRIFCFDVVFYGHYLIIFTMRFNVIYLRNELLNGLQNEIEKFLIASCDLIDDDYIDGLNEAARTHTNPCIKANTEDNFRCA